MHVRTQYSVYHFDTPHIWYAHMSYGFYKTIPFNRMTFALTLRKAESDAKACVLKYSGVTAYTG